MLTNLLTNALSNGQKCLVVSESVADLQQAQQYLSKAGLDQLHYLLRDPRYDHALLAEILRAVVAGGFPVTNYDKSQWNFLLEKCRREQQKLNVYTQTIRTPLFGQADWTDTVGMYLCSNRQEGRELLNSQLSPIDFSFTPEEHEELKSGIEQIKPLFARVQTLKHPLRWLHPVLFTGMSQANAFSYIQEQTRLFSSKTAQLQHRYITKTNEYAEKLTGLFQQYFQQMDQRSTALLETIGDFSRRYGSDFEQSGIGSLQFKSIFSSKPKQALAAKKQVIDQFEHLRKTFQQEAYFDFHFSKEPNTHRMDKVAAEAHAFREQLYQWGRQMPDLVTEEIQRLSEKTVHPRLDHQEQIGELEYALDLLLEELNEARLFSSTFEHNMLTIPKRQKYLEEVQEKLETIQHNMREFGTFYDWQRAWLQLPPAGQKLITALVKVKPRHWAAAFESWYFHHCLSRMEKNVLPIAEPQYDRDETDIQALQGLMRKQIAAWWQDNQRQFLKQFKRDHRETYQRIFEKSKSPLHSWDLLLGDGLEAVSTIMPVLFCTPAVAVQIPK